jgi:CHAD domain-containing protein
VSTKLHKDQSGPAGFEFHSEAPGFPVPYVLDDPRPTPRNRILRLDAGMNAGEAASAVCLTLLDTLLANEEGVYRSLDPGFLHGFRVAGRRTRSALTQLGKVFTPDARKHFRREFKWLGTVTGPARDLDVHLKRMEESRMRYGADMDADLRPLGEYLRDRRSDEHGRLKAALVSTRYRALVSAWRGHLVASPAEDFPTPMARRPVVPVASERIWHAYRRATRHGRAIGPGAPGSALHDLRIDCKKLRYLLEFFDSLYDADAIAPPVKALKRLQDNLGEFNDLEIQQAVLARLAREMQQDGLAPANCLLAMGRLIGHYERQQKKERRRFAQCFARFDDAGTRRRFKGLFRQGRRR